MRYRGYGTPGLGVVGYIIITCVVVFVATFISPRLISVLEFVPANFSQHPWTVLTSIFVHGSITHILFNMLVLYFFGGFLVSLVGARKFLLVYLLGGLAGNLVFALLASPYGGVVGASGAIFAVEGALVLMRPRRRHRRLLSDVLRLGQHCLGGPSGRSGLRAAGGPVLQVSGNGAPLLKRPVQ
jgi:membrane associated rhomboid family serine protease